MFCLLWAWINCRTNNQWLVIWKAWTPMWRNGNSTSCCGGDASKLSKNLQFIDVHVVISRLPRIFGNVYIHVPGNIKPRVTVLEKEICKWENMTRDMYMPHQQFWYKERLKWHIYIGLILRRFCSILFYSYCLNDWILLECCTYCIYGSLWSVNSFIANES